MHPITKFGLCVETNTRFSDPELARAISLPSLNARDGCRNASGSSISRTVGSPAMISVMMPVKALTPSLDCSIGRAAP